MTEQQYDTARLNELAKRHLWMHFTRHASYATQDVPIMVRGEGCYVWDQHGKRYLDGLSGLFTVQAGHGRAELAEAALKAEPVSDADIAHEIAPCFIEKNGEINAITAYIFGLKHEIGHYEQLCEAARQAREAFGVG